MKVLCLGDSLTFGSIGYSYTKFLKKKYKVINKGINGDTTKCAYKRLQKYINSQFYNDVDLYVIAIGTNDLLIPYLTTLSTLWKMQMMSRVKLKKCIKNKTIFEIEYEKYIKLIIEHKKKLILIGSPIIQLAYFPNEKIIERNKIIKDLAKKYNLPFIDPTFLQSQFLNKNIYSYSWKNKNLVRIFDATIMFVLPFSKDWFSKIRDLELTVDGVHFNSLSAKLISKEIITSIEKSNFKN